MSTGDKIKNAVDSKVGDAKKNAGAMTGDHDLEAEGRAQGDKADIKQAAEKVKDVFKG